MKSAPQLFAERMLLSTLSIPKILLLSKFGNKLPLSAKTKRECVILGNGPSLTQSIEEHKTLLANSDLFSVNFFCTTEEYTQLKPRFLVAAAPEFYLEKLNDFYRDFIPGFYKGLIDNTQWDLEIFMPVEAKKYSHWKKQIQGNNKIHVNYYNNTPVEGFEGLTHWAINNGLGMPRPHNVLIPTIIMALRMGYEKIHLIGADHSWLKDLWVDDNNLVMLRQKHFYDEASAKANPMYKKGQDTRKLHEALQKFVISFEAYFTLEKFAKKKGQRIINLTPGSFIDAFERKQS